MVEGRFQLSWDDEQRSGVLLDQASALLASGDFTDVTLVSEDGEQLPAHKLVLAACSSVFRNIFCRSKASTDLHLYMHGLRGAHLSSLLTFMYLGRAEVPHNTLEGFLQAARGLGVRGLEEAGRGAPGGGEGGKDSPSKLTENSVKSERVTNNRNAQLFQCKDCNTVIKTRSNFRKHCRKQHKQQIEEECSKCRNKFSNSKTLKAHSFECQCFCKCGKVYNKYCDFKKHCRRAHPIMAEADMLLLKNGMKISQDIKNEPFAEELSMKSEISKQPSEEEEYELEQQLDHMNDDHRQPTTILP
jgi:hypothetical protein